ncbi:T9SS type A sorting domain-containing protein [Fulvivirga lutimaris]|uniref:T9SS type A sorting domain-containing protein n=1 Tax=Fulvivirga lutimaris TaxID=1819566 RepID=UPI0012BD3D97|nr:T9SS type A sorting domain-containing protein [Fulvivirga lutimaris]MTI40522.1 T9SS type A sorting domain-containing protein [Fulvivirga lutimaris]
MTKFNTNKLKRSLGLLSQRLILIALLFGYSLAFAAPPADPTFDPVVSDDSELNLSWTNPGAFDEVMIIASSGAITHVPSGDGSAYTADADFGSGTPAEPLEFVVYIGTGTGVTVTGLANSTIYNFKIFARGGDGTEWSAGVDASGTPRPNPVSNESFTSTCIDEGTVSWTNPATAYNVVVFAKEGSAITVGTPSAAPTGITADPIFGDGDPYENDAAAFCIYNGSGETIDITGLTINTDYHFLIFNAQDGPTSYSTDVTFNNSSASAVSNASGLSAAPSDGEIDLTWTNPPTCYDEVLVVASVNNAVNVTPATSTTYTGNANYTSGHDFGSGDFAVYNGTGTSVTVTGLNNGTTYHFEIFARRGDQWSSGGIVDNAAAVDLTPPVITVYDPADNGLAAASLATLTLTFDDNIAKATGGISDDTDRIVLYDENDNQVLPIDKNSGLIVASTNQVTIDVSGYSFVEGTNYYVLIGDDVLENTPGGVAFGGISDPTTWDFTIAGTTVTPPAALNVCANSPSRTLGDIIIEESAPDDFSTAGTIIYGLDPNSGFVFEPGIGSATFESISNGNDINGIDISVSFTSFTITYTFDDASNVSTDRIVISGLKLSSDGSEVTTDIIRTGGTATMNANEVADNLIHAIINSGAAPTTPSAITTSPTPFEACEGENLAGFSVTVGSGTSNLTWYSDASLSTPIGSAAGNANPSATQLGLSSATAGTYTVYVTQTTTCESDGVPVTFTVNPSLTADAGANGETYCNDETFQLGGSPTLSNPSVPGAYTYSWTELTGGPVTIDPVSIPSTANPTISVTNNTNSIQSLQFQVEITDVNGCSNTAIKSLDIRPPVELNLTAPTSSNFAPNGEPQDLTANPSGGTFSGVGVVQSGANFYQFDPSVAYDDNQPLPQSIPIYYSVTDGNGCTVTNEQIATFNLSNQTFTNVSAEYCSDEYPTGNGIILSADAAAETNALNRVNSWNNSTRFYYFPATWVANNYTNGQRVRYLNDVYQAKSSFFSFTTPNLDPANWTLIPDFLKVEWKGMIRNYYEGYYQGNVGSATIIKLGSTYPSPTLAATNFNYYGMRTNPDYNNCPTCSYLYPATYIEFINPGDIAYILSNWNVGYYYGLGTLVQYTVSPGNTRVYKSLLASNTGNTPNFSPSAWQDVTNTDYDNGNYFHVNDGGFRSGFYTSGQFVRVNQVPVVNFSGLESDIVNPLQFCNINEEYELTASNNGGKFYIDGVEATVSSSSEGLVDLDGTGPKAIFNPLNAGLGAHTIRFELDPGTDGSSGDPCFGSFEININVLELPDIFFNGSTPSNSTVFCYDEAPITLTSTQTTNVVYTGLGVTNGAAGTGTFDPNQAFSQREVELGTTLTTPQDFTVTVTYTNAQGCQNIDTRTYQVRPLPPASFTYGTKSDFCFEDDPVNLDGANPSGSYEIYYVRQPALPNVLIDSDNDNQYTFDPAAIFQLAVDAGASELSTPTIRVIYTTNDPVKTSCINTQIEQFTVAPIIPVNISGVDDGETFCANSGARTLTMSPPGGVFTINGIGTTLVNGESYTLDRSPDGGILELEYVLTTGTGCTSTITKNIDILPSPQASFNAPPQCDGDEVVFQSLNNSNAENITWILGDNTIETGSVDDLSQITHQYPNPNQYYVKLILEGNSLLPLTCIDSTDQFVTIGGIPEASFDFSKVCQGELTEFVGTSSNNAFLASYSWEFGDGDVLAEGISTDPIPPGTHGGKTTGTYANPIHQYETDGTYTVRLLGKSQTAQGACPDDEVRELSILKNVNASTESPYAMVQLNGEDGFWKTEDLNNNSTWEFGQPSGSIIAASELAWGTNLAGSYLSNDQSFVNSPCFDLSAIDRPVVSLDYWSDTQRESDGAVLQYSTDGGFSWQTLGSVQNGLSTGLNWYNQSGITGNPGGQNLFGWSRAGDTEWNNARHALDVIPEPRDNVRLRIAFGSNGDTELEGFAFKDVRIEDRNKIVLMEHFTNEATPTAADNYVRAFGANSSEIIKLEYRTDFPQEDARNEANKADNNSRVAYYGVTNSPTTLIDGEGEPSLISSGWGDILFSQKTLVTSPFSIVSGTSIVEQDLQVNIVVTADAPITDDNSIVHVVLAEKDVNSAEFIYKMIKMLPNAAGTKLNNGLAIGQGETFNINLETKINEPLDPALSAIIVFIQNEDTGIVYQAAVNNLSELPPVVTSLNELANKAFDLYPNPANDQVTILFNQNLRNGTLKIYDNFGKLVFDKTIEETSLTLSTHDFASGMYHIQVSNDDKVLRKRLIITHSDR